MFPFIRSPSRQPGWGGIQGDQAARGVTIAFEDLLIAATALQLGFGVATSNIRHFQVVPELTIVQA